MDFLSVHKEINYIKLKIYCNAACCHSVKLCAFAARDFQSQQSGVVDCEKEGMLLQPLSWRYVESAIHRERVVGEEQHTNICGANKQ